MPWQDARKDRAYGLAAWKRARDACLKHARWKCEIRLDGICTGTASEADHIYGLANDPQHKHLRAACKPCHKTVTQQQAQQGSKRAAADPKPTPRTAW